MKQNTKTMKQIGKIVKKPEFWMGGITVFCLVSVLYAVMFGRFVRETQKYDTDMRITPTTNASTFVLSPTPVPENRPAVSKLAETGVVYEVVLDGDNFWKISKRVCGTGVYYESIQYANGYEDRTLLPGDTIVVTCSF